MDIIILILLCIRIYNILKNKGYAPTPWLVRVIVAWIVFEIIGAGISYLLQSNLYVIAFSGLITALGSYLYFYQKAVDLPDARNSGNGTKDY